VESRALTIDDIPLCGLSCLFLTIPQTPCPLSDYACQCQNANLAHTLPACLLANCTMADNLNTAKVQRDLCQLSNESRQHEVYIYTITTYTIATFCVILRLIGRVVTNKLAYDDYIIITALLLTTIPFGVVLKMAGIGFGEHLWNLEHGQLLSNLRFFYIAWAIYTVVLGLTKISLIIFYLEIFSTKRARLASYTLLGYISITSSTLLFLSIFNCTPVRAFWDRDVKHARCLDINAIAYVNSGSAIAQDVVLLVLPLLCISKLDIKRARKVAVGVMFGIGTLGCIATIVRLHTLVILKSTIDPTWDYVPVTVWTEIELACCFVCVSLPAIRVLLLRIMPK
ncbi:hypothetical protein CC80DRAFT_383297, partial [Byssothecium circinans]